jgi:hypothetical protein
MTARPIPERKDFSNLSDAIAFIVECLESDAFERLHSQMESAQAKLARRPDHLDYFSRFLFQPLLAIQQRTDLRELYRDREFPMGEVHYKLGGHMQELRCIHIDFVKGERGWSLCDIWLCR